MSIDGNYVVKIIEPVTSSVTVLAVYLLARRYLKEPYAFLAAFYFIIPRVMSPMLAGRMAYSLLFFAVLMLVLLHDRVGPVAKKALIIIFILSLIISHYATAMFVLGSLAVGYLVFQIINRWKRAAPALLVPTMLVLFLVLSYAWYAYMVQHVFVAVTQFGSYSVESLAELFEPRQAGLVRSALFGSMLPEGIAYQIELLLHWISFVLIAVGLLMLTIGWRRTLQIHNDEGLDEPGGRADFLVKRFKFEHFALMVTFCIVLVALVIIPHVSKGYSWQRAYAPTLVILAPLLVIGCIALARLIRVKAQLIAVLILIPTFLFASGVAYQFLGTPKSLALSTETQDYYIAYVHEQDAKAARWIGGSMTDSAKVYSDLGSRQALNSQGLVDPLQFTSLYQIYYRYSRWAQLEEGYVYLRYYNTVDEMVVDIYERDIHELSWYSEVFDSANKLYDNGSAQVLFIRE